MHILYIHQYFATPLGCTGTRSYEFARRWAAKGHKVTMLTSTAQLTNEDLANVRGLFLKRFTIGGINVLALRIPYRQQMGVFKRCLSFFTFMVLSSLFVLFLRKVDVVYASSTPITIGVPALVAKKLRHKKIVFEERDHWLASAIELKLIRNKLLIKILSWLERTIYKNSDAIITVSQGIAEWIRQDGGEGKSIYVITNGSDLDLFRPDIDGSAIRKEKGWNDKLVLVYAGVMGWINSLEFIVDVAERVRDHDDILFALIGQGSSKSNLERLIEERGLRNIQILPSVPKRQLPVFLAAADVIMATIGKFTCVERQASLNKVYDGLGAGRCILLNYRGWQGGLIQDKEAGFGCKLYDVDEFVEKVLYLNSQRDKLITMGRNARRLAVEQFDRDKLAAQALAYIELTLSRV
jgi:glycosyltransferase involved in cell wall biosynthesis